MLLCAGLPVPVPALAADIEPSTAPAEIPPATASLPIDLTNPSFLTATPLRSQYHPHLRQVTSPSVVVAIGRCRSDECINQRVEQRRALTCRCSSGPKAVRPGCDVPA